MTASSITLLLDSASAGTYPMQHVLPRRRRCPAAAATGTRIAYQTDALPPLRDRCTGTARATEPIDPGGRTPNVHEMDPSRHDPGGHARRRHDGEPRGGE